MVALVAIAGAACRPVPPPIATLSTPEETRQQILASDAPLTLVHLWATWCDPCREEFPEVLKTYETFKGQGFRLLLVSADNPEDVDTVNAFLLEHDSPVGSLVSTELSQEFMELFSTNWSGALPASFFIDDQGEIVAEWSGKRTFEEYAGTIGRLLKP